jgi:hypothetical protein
VIASVLAPCIAIGTAWIASVGAESSNVAVRIEQLGDLPSNVKSAIIADLSRSLAEIAGLSAIVDESETSDEILAVKLLAGALSARCIAIRSSGAEAPRGVPFEIDLNYDAASYRPAFDRLVRAVYPEQVARRSAELAAEHRDLVTPAPTAKSPRLAPWIVLGGSAVAGALGIALGISSASDLDSLASSPHSATEYRDISSRASTRAIAADVLFVAAAAGAVLGIALFFGD